MRTPCRECLVLSCCIHTCKEAEIFRTNIEAEVLKFERFVKTKNGSRRKNIPENKRKHWNALIAKHNEHVHYWNNRLMRILEG